MVHTTEQAQQRGRQREQMKSKDIKALRKKLKLTQKGLAEKVGVDQVTVNRWENEAARPSQLAIRQLERLRKGNNERD